MKDALKRIQRKLFRNYIFSGSRFIQGFTRNLTKEKLFLEKLNLKGKTVYEIGCAAGIFTMFFARSVGKEGKVIAFEPVASNYDIAIKNFKSQNFSNIDLFNIGLGRCQENRSIAIRADETATASMNEDAIKVISAQAGSQILNVQIDSLDSFIQDNNLPDPHFVKIDVEGLEIEVLEGMKETVQRCKPQLCIENHGEGEDKKYVLIRDVTNFLLSRGYEIFHIESETRINANNFEVAKEGHIYCK